MLKLVDVSAGYSVRSEPIVRGMSMTFERKTLLLGPNGAGKTTLFRTICGLTVKRSGKIYIDGVDLDHVRGTPQGSWWLTYQSSTLC